MGMKVIDGKLVEVDAQGNPVVAPGVITDENSLKTPEVGPLSGTKNDVSVSTIVKDSQNALTESPGRLSDANKELRNKLREEFKDDTEEQIDEKLLRKIETEGRAAADRDSEAARALPHTGVNQPETADSSVMREDGTVTTEQHPEFTAHYLNGTRVLVTDEQKAKYDEMLAEINRLMGDVSPGDIPLGDPYYIKKAELDAFVARLKR